MTDQIANQAFRLVHEHSRRLELDYHEWVDVNSGHEWRDFLGRKNGENYRWNILRCNNPDCFGEAMYRANLIMELVADWEESRRG